MNKRLFIIAVVVAAFAGLAFAEGPHKYIGVKKCSMCHRAEAKGNQHGQWLATKHARAYEALATPQAKETAQKAGVAGDPQQAPECLRCHVTAFGLDEGMLGPGFKKEDGIQCEACHGAGGDYWKMSVMKDKQQAIAAGMIMPDEKVCKSCHNEESPNFAGFDFEESYKEISHPRP